MMSDRNKEIVKEVLIGMVAKEKLDKILEYLANTKEIKKEDILDIISSDEDIDFME